MFYICVHIRAYTRATPGPTPMQVYTTTAHIMMLYITVIYTRDYTRNYAGIYTNVGCFTFECRLRSASRCPRADELIWSFLETGSKRDVVRQWPSWWSEWYVGGSQGGSSGSEDRCGGRHGDTPTECRRYSHVSHRRRLIIG